MSQNSENNIPESALYCNGWLYSHRKAGSETDSRGGAVQLNFFQRQFINNPGGNYSPEWGRNKIQSLPIAAGPTGYFSRPAKVFKSRV